MNTPNYKSKASKKKNGEIPIGSDNYITTALSKSLGDNSSLQNAHLDLNLMENHSSLSPQSSSSIDIIDGECSNLGNLSHRPLVRLGSPQQFEIEDSDEACGRHSPPGDHLQKNSMQVVKPHSKALARVAGTSGIHNVNIPSEICKVIPEKYSYIIF